MSIYLIRHGETPGNATRVLQMPDTPLSERGMRQAQRLAERLAAAGIAEILSSDMARAEMTARALEAATGAPLAFDPLLQERNFGDLRGRAYDDLGLDPFAPDYAPPGGESWSVFYARVTQAWGRVLERSATVSGHLAVVTHGLVCHAVTSREVGLPESLTPGETVLRFGNTALTIIGGAEQQIVELLACTAHLEDAAGGRSPEGAGIA